MNKLKLKGMNALFGLRIQITVGENMLMGLASATGVYLAALPTPGGIQIAGKTPNDGSYEQHISHMQKKINDTIAKNKELYEINPPVSKINLHCEYVSYCLGVSLFWGYLILDIKYFFFTVENCSPHYSFFSPPFTIMLKCLLLGS